MKCDKKAAIFVHLNPVKYKFQAGGAILGSYKLPLHIIRV